MARLVTRPCGFRLSVTRYIQHHFSNSQQHDRTRCIIALLRAYKTAIIRRVTRNCAINRQRTKEGRTERLGNER